MFFWIKTNLIKNPITNFLGSLEIAELDVLLWLQLELFALQYLRIGNIEAQKDQIEAEAKDADQQSRANTKSL